MDPVPYDGAVDVERLQFLLGLQLELPSLVYKQQYLDYKQQHLLDVAGK